MLAFYEIFMWLLLLLLKIIFTIPLLIKGLFRRKKQCPPVDDNNLLIPAHQLVQKIIAKELTCTSVITSYINRIKIVNPLLNAIVEDRFDKALSEASEIDNLISSTKLTKEELQAKYPLLGLPITIKESIGVKGLSNAAGSYAYRNKKAEVDAEIVTAVKNAGAIILLVSNTPELCLNWEASNNLTGHTCNPYDTRKTSGGSSGGEASLLGAAGSLISLGSDIAGSLRLPAHFCGVFGHKPTANSVSVIGHFPTSTDSFRWNNFFSLGPMARYAEDLPLLMNIIVKDEFRPLLNLNKTVNISKLKFYYVESSGSVLNNKIDREIVNSMRDVVKYFKEVHNVEIKKLNFEYFKESPAISLLPLLEIKGIEQICTNNIYLELLKYLFCLTKSTFSGTMYFLILDAVHRIFKKETFDKYSEKKDKVQKKLEEILGEDGILLYPSFSGVAHFHSMYLCKLLDCSYMTMFNAVGFPATNCPIRLNSNGMPMGLQIVAKRNCDRLTMAVAREIEIGFGGWRQSEKNDSKV